MEINTSNNDGLNERLVVESRSLNCVSLDILSFLQRSRIQQIIMQSLKVYRDGKSKKLGPRGRATLLFFSALGTVVVRRRTHIGHFIYIYQLGLIVFVDLFALSQPQRSQWVDGR